jgi:hypothetical protein
VSELAQQFSSSWQSAAVPLIPLGQYPAHVVNLASDFVKFKCHGFSRRPLYLIDRQKAKVKPPPIPA